MSEQTPVEDVNRGYELLITTTVFTAAIALTTITRVLIKLYFQYHLGIDDGFIILGTVLNLIANGFNYKATLSGFGRHTAFLTVDEEVEAVKCAQIAIIIANWAIWAVKLSVCFFLLNIMRSIHNRFRWAVYSLIITTSITALLASILWGTQAQPIAKLWDSRIDGTRVSPAHFLIIVYVVYAFGCFTDVFYALSPLYFLWSIQLDWKKKLPIVLLTGCGLLVFVVGVLNIIFARSFLQEKDITWDLINEFICDIVERNLSAFVANLPALWLLVVQLRKRSPPLNGPYSLRSPLPYHYSRNNSKVKKNRKDHWGITSTSMADGTTHLHMDDFPRKELHHHQKNPSSSNSTDSIDMQPLTSRTFSRAI